MDTKSDKETGEPVKSGVSVCTTSWTAVAVIPIPTQRSARQMLSPHPRLTASTPWMTMRRCVPLFELLWRRGGNAENSYSASDPASYSSIRRSHVLGAKQNSEYGFRWNLSLALSDLNCETVQEFLQKKNWQICPSCIRVEWENVPYHFIIGHPEIIALAGNTLNTYKAIKPEIK